jgi:hypothetical protein
MREFSRRAWSSIEADKARGTGDLFQKADQEGTGNVQEVGCSLGGERLILFRNDCNRLAAIQAPDDLEQQILNLSRNVVLLLVCSDDPGAALRLRSSLESSIW